MINHVMKNHIHRLMVSSTKLFNPNGITIYLNIPNEQGYLKVVSGTSSSKINIC